MGRPRKPDALTAAQRQAQFRERTKQKQINEGMALAYALELQFNLERLREQGEDTFCFDLTSQPVPVAANDWMHAICNQAREKLCEVKAAKQQHKRKASRSKKPAKTLAKS